MNAIKTTVEAENFIYQIRFNIDLISFISLTVEITLNRER